MYFQRLSDYYVFVALKKLQFGRLELFGDFFIRLYWAIPAIDECTPKFINRGVKTLVKTPLAYSFYLNRKILLIRVENDLYFEIYLILKLLYGLEQLLLSLSLLSFFLVLRNVVLVAWRLLRAVSCCFRTRRKPPQIWAKLNIQNNVVLTFRIVSSFCFFLSFVQAYAVLLLHQF